jgi:hypothetical protein
VRVLCIRLMVGERLVDAFEKRGGVNLLFWNSRVFAEIFLELLCDKPVEFDHWFFVQLTQSVAYFNH